MPDRVREVLGRTPLRVKLIALVLLLVTLGLAVTSVAGVSVLQGYMLSQADEQLTGTSQQLERQVEQHWVQLATGNDVYLRVPSNVYMEVHGGDGSLLAKTPTDATDGTPKIPVDVSERVGGKFTVGSSGSHADWRVQVREVDDVPGGGFLVTARSLSDVKRTINQLIFIDVLVGAAVLAALAVVGIWMVRVSMRPLAAIEQTAGAIAAGDLSRRVPDADPATEVGRLGRSLNSMLTQIEAAFQARAQSEATARRSEERMRRFVADASHELRTPLTAIRGFAEFYRQGAAREPDEVDRLIGRIEDAASRMGLLVEDLLLLARLDRQRPLQHHPVDLLAIAADAVQEARVVSGGDHDIELSVDGGMAYQVLGDENRLRQVLGNLLNNALTHTPAGTPVEVRLRPGTLPPDTPALVCEVADKGPGLAPEQAERVFERFYRADQARTREDGGTGLGLAIVAALIAAHGGKVEVDTAPGEGSVFRVVLPLATD